MAKAGTRIPRLAPWLLGAVSSTWLLFVVPSYGAHKLAEQVWLGCLEETVSCEPMEVELALVRVVGTSESSYTVSVYGERVVVITEGDSVSRGETLSVRGVLRGGEVHETERLHHRERWIKTALGGLGLLILVPYFFGLARLMRRRDA